MTTDDKDAARDGYARRKADTTIKSEPRTYRNHGDHSYFQDLGLSVLPIPESAEARKRLTRHEQEMDAEIASGSVEGRRAQVVRSRETRAQSTTTAVGFTTPQYLTDLWAGYRSPNRSFVDSTTLLPLPSVGVQINVPSLTSVSPTSQQTENSGVSTASPTGANIQQPVVTFASAVPVSQQLFDRGGMTAHSFDQILLAQLKLDQDAKIDLYAINQVIAGTASTITDNAAYTTALLYTDIAKARESLADTAGTRLKATHVFMTTDLWSFVSRQVDGQQRPIVTPAFSAEPWASLKAQGDSAGDGWMGHVLPGDIALFSDDNIPALGANTQVIVSRPNTVLSFESDPIPYAYPETHAQNLTVVLGVRKYACVIARFPNAHTVITGNAYPTSAI